MNLSEIILVKIKKDHRGKENSCKRRYLLSYAHYFEPDLTDRKLRKLVKRIPKICTFERGYFIATSKEESDYSIEYLKKKIYPLWEDVKNIQLAYPEFYQDEQLRLF